MKKLSLVTLTNCAGIFTGEGFQKKNGRKIKDNDASFVAGPLDVTIDYDRGLILQIAETSKRNKFSTEHELFDASGLWISSAFYDSHTHALFSGTRAREYFQRWAGKTYLEISESGGGIHNTMRTTLEALRDNDLFFLNDFSQRLESMYRSGTCVVEIKSGYSPTPEGELLMLKFLSDFNKSRPANRRPKILSTFLPLHALPKNTSETKFLNEMLELLPTIKKGNFAQFVDAFPEKGFFSLESAIKLFKSAGKYGLKIKVHSDELSDMKSVETFCKMGALSVDHLQKVSKKGISILASSKTVGTVLPATSFFSNIPYVDARNLINAGVQVALATDYNPGTAPELSMGFSMRLAASQLKMSAAEIFCSATFNGAAALGLSKNCGVVKKGYAANLCLWKTQTQNPKEVLEEIIVDGLLPSAVCSPFPTQF